jgi:outer membrane receptor for ferrienterochelin and colicin
MKIRALTFIIGCLSAPVVAAQVNDTIPAEMSGEVKEVVVSGHRSAMKPTGLTNTTFIGDGELTKAACCNLGESFTNNPSVDVSYADPATGAKQIKLLGLSGSYVQMLTENIPNFRGAAAPYSLGYVPGPWMQSIQVSKGSASVKNGYESITGQINIEYLKPQGIELVEANVYANTMSRVGQMPMRTSTWTRQRS